MRVEPTGKTDEGLPLYIASRQDEPVVILIKAHKLRISALYGIKYVEKQPWTKEQAKSYQESIEFLKSVGEKFP